MIRVILLTALLILGVVLSQYLPYITGSQYSTILFIVKTLAMVCLSYIMIHIGLEFTIDRSKMGEYVWDYFVAFTAASLPWLFCSLYFVYAYQHDPAQSAFHIWTDSLLLGRFAAPTSAGILFTLLAAVGLGTSWVFKKVRILAIFDDLDTILLLVPIKFMIIGFHWELVALVLIPICLMLYIGWKKHHSILLPIDWYWIVIYSIAITLFCEFIHYITNAVEGILPLSIEVLLPAFILGCVLTTKKGETQIGLFLKTATEKRARLVISIIFMTLVGLLMPPIDQLTAKAPEKQVEQKQQQSIWESKVGSIPLKKFIIDVLLITLLSNLGKMFPLFCYRKEARVWQRASLSLGMCLRGEVGAGIIVISLGLISHIDKSLIAVAIISLALNFVLTGPFIMIIKRLHTKHLSPL